MVRLESPAPNDKASLRVEVEPIAESPLRHKTSRHAGDEYDHET